MEVLQPLAIRRQVGVQSTNRAKKIFSDRGIYDIPISEGWELYTLIDAFAYRPFAFQRNLRHLLDSYAMLFLKHLQRLAHHVDKFVARASRLQHVDQQPIHPYNSIRGRTSPSTVRMTAPVQKRGDNMSRIPPDTCLGRTS